MDSRPLAPLKTPKLTESQAIRKFESGVDTAISTGKQVISTGIHRYKLASTTGAGFEAANALITQAYGDITYALDYKEREKTCLLDTAAAKIIRRSPRRL